MGKNPPEAYSDTCIGCEAMAGKFTKPLGQQELSALAKRYVAGKATREDLLHILTACRESGISVTWAEDCLQGKAAADEQRLQEALGPQK